MTPLERRARRLLHVYPAVYRHERGAEIISTLIEASADRRWPRLSDVRALTVGGLKARAAQNRQRTAVANLRVAVMAGLAIYAAFWVAAYLYGVVQGLVPNSVHPPGWTSWPAAVTALLAGGIVVLAWTAPRVWVLAGALATSVAIVSFALANDDVLAPPFIEALSLMGLAVLAPRVGHPSRHWLWPFGAIVFSSPLLALGVGYGWLGYSWLRLAPGALQFFIAVGAILWVGIDARLLAAVLTYLAVTAIEEAVIAIPSGAAFLATIPFLLVVASLTASTIWLLRRQSARAIRAD